MDLPEYTGTIHPVKWLKQIQICCYLKEITDEQKILRICKLKIDSSINIPDEIDTFDKLIKLFNDVVFHELNIIKYDSLIALRHVSTGRYLSSRNINYETGSKRQVVSILYLFNKLIMSLNNFIEKKNFFKGIY